jgi:hypothetical protein
MRVWVLESVTPAYAETDSTGLCPPLVGLTAAESRHPCRRFPVERLHR